MAPDRLVRTGGEKINRALGVEAVPLKRTLQIVPSVQGNARRQGKPTPGLPGVGCRTHLHLHCGREVLSVGGRRLAIGNALERVNIREAQTR